MGLSRSVVRLSALVALTSIFASACRKGKVAESRDAASDDAAGNTADRADASVVDDAVAPLASAASAASAPTATELASLMPPSTPFAGTYRCFGAMKLEQSGRIVTATIRKGTTDTIIVCTAGNDTCTGTVREIQTVQGKAPKVMHVKPITLTRTSGGDVVYVVGSAEKKAGRGEQTFCPRR